MDRMEAAIWDREQLRSMKDRAETRYQEALLERNRAVQAYREACYVVSDIRDEELARMRAEAGQPTPA